METLRDIFSNLKNRFSNPLISSFIIAWLSLNWKVITIFLYTPGYYAIKNNFKTIFAVINENTSAWNSIYLPIILAILYTLIYPLLNNTIRAFNAWNKKWGENWNLSILKNGSIPIDKYLKLRKEYENKIKTIEEIISSESKALERSNEVFNENIKLKTSLNESINELNWYKEKKAQINDVNMLNGTWINKFKESPDKMSESEEIKIENGRYYEIIEFNKLKHTFNINDFHYNGFDEKPKILFVKVGAIEGDSFNLKRRLVNRLEVVDENTLIGYEDYYIEIEYKRK